MDSRTIIKSLRVENFGCFNDRKIVFDPGFNQIVGANETGKSTVIKALFTVLFEDGSTQKKGVASWHNWTANRPFKLTLEFSVGEKDFSIIRDYKTGHDLMTDSDGIVYEGKAITEKIALYFGASERSLFESIFCFSSDSPAAPESSKERLKSAIETPVFYGFDRGRADRYLDEEIKKLDNPRAHGPRELDVISEQISCRLQEKSEQEKRIEALDKDKKELEEVRLKLREHESAIERLDREIEGGTAYHAVNGRMVNLEERLQVHLGNYSRAAQVADDLVRVEKELFRLTAPDEDVMGTILADREEFSAKVEQSKQAMDELIGRRKKANRGFAAATLILVLLCLTYVVQQNGYLKSGALTDLLPYTIPVMVLVWLFRMGVYLTQFHRKKKATTLFRESVAQLDAFYAGLNEKYNQKAADPVQALEETIQRKNTLAVSAENLRNTINALSEGKGLDFLNKTREQIESEVSALNQELAPLTSFALFSGKLPALKEELISRRVRSNALRERAALLNERCSVIDRLQKNLKEIDEEVEILKRKHKNVTERLEVLKITRNALNRAADHLIEDTFEAYSASASSFLIGLTEGRYNRLRFSRETGRFEIKPGGLDRWFEITDSFSSSTRDCVYLALRWAGVALLSAEFCPPIILDQAETRMDKSRRKAFFELLRKNSQKRQIIYVGLEKIDSLPDTHLIEFTESSVEPLTSPTA